MKNNLGTIGKYKWFLAQVVTDQNQVVKDDWEYPNTWGERVKIRIPGMHPQSSSEVDGNNLPWAIVAKPTTCGSKNTMTAGVWGGEWVIGFFLDEGEQQPVITHVLGNNLHNHEVSTSSGFKRINRFNSGMKPGTHQIGKGSAPETPAEPNKDEFKNLDSKVDTENKSEQLESKTKV